MTTPPDTALACLDEGERELLAKLERSEEIGWRSTVALIRRLCERVEKTERVLSSRTVEMESRRVTISQRDAEIAELKGRIAEAEKGIKPWDYAAKIIHLEGKLADRDRRKEWAVKQLRQMSHPFAPKLADYLEGKGDEV